MDRLASLAYKKKNSSLKTTYILIFLSRVHRNHLRRSPNWKQGILNQVPTKAASNYGNFADRLGLWDGVGANNTYPYQLLIYDHAFYSGFFLSGYRNCEADTWRKKVLTWNKLIKSHFLITKQLKACYVSIWTPFIQLIDNRNRRIVGEGNFNVLRKTHKSFSLIIPVYCLRLWI